MLEREQVSVLFADARELYADALTQVQLGYLRNAAEKAWGATKRATDALVLARNGSAPRTAGQAARSIRALARSDPALADFADGYFFRQSFLHGKCFYDGVCEPAAEVIFYIQTTLDYIQTTLDYIQTAETLAGR